MALSHQALVKEGLESQQSKVLGQIHLRTGSASPELHGAVLPVKGKEVDIDGTGTAEDGRRKPVHPTGVIQQDVAGIGDLELAVIAGKGEKAERPMKC